jgi:hypothetical protein
MKGRSGVTLTQFISSSMQRDSIQCLLTFTPDLVLFARWAGESDQWGA